MKKIILLFAVFAMAAFAQTKAQTKAKSAPPDLLRPSTLKAQAPPVFDAKFTTTKGDFTIKVTRSWAPLGADRFYNLVRAGFYTDAGFFRIVPGFVVQFGISARPAVSKVWDNAYIVDDIKKQSNTRGTVTFATAGPSTRTTQMFINLGDNRRLDADGFTPIGEVTAGMDIVEKLYSGYGERPDQGQITNQGKMYLDKNFPMLDRILTATVVPVATDNKK